MEEYPSGLRGPPEERLEGYHNTFVGVKLVLPEFKSPFLRQVTGVKRVRPIAFVPHAEKQEDS